MTSNNIEGVTVCRTGVRGTRTRPTVLQVEERERERVDVSKRDKEADVLLCSM